MSAEPELEGGLGYPQTNSALPENGPFSRREEGNQTTSRPDVPTPEERITELIETYPDLAFTELSQVDGRKLRDELTIDRSPSFYVQGDTPAESGFLITTDETEPDEVRAITVAQGLAEMFDWYEEYRDMALRFERGKWDRSIVNAYELDVDPKESFLVLPTNSYHPEYHRKQLAQLKALERETVGYQTCAECETFYCQRPAEHDVTGQESGAFDRPVTVLMSLTTSSRPAGDIMPPVDHDREIVDTWVQEVRRAMRYALEDVLDLDRSEYVWHRQGEPHTGGGAASCYRHDHPGVVLEGAGLELEEIREAFRGVVAKHVAECEGATWDAHRIDTDDPRKSALSVRELEIGGDGAVDSFSGYMAEYLSLEDEDFLERSTEYQVFALSQWATASQKYSRSTTATNAIVADACKQQYDSEDYLQTADHGEELCRSDRPGYEFECAHCGSPWGVAQDHETLTEARLSGGRVVDESVSPSRLTGSWTSASSVAATGPDGDVDGEDRGQGWQLGALVIDGEEYGVSPGAVEMTALKLPDQDNEWEWEGADPRGVPDRPDREDRPPPDREADRNLSQQELVDDIMAVLRAATEPLTASEIAGRRMLDPSDVEHRLDKLAAQGRIYEPPEGRGYSLS